MLVLRMSDDDFAGVLDANLVGGFRVAKRAVQKMMRARWGRIIFLGSAVYFAYGLYRPVWGNAKGQLVGFLAYDLVLIVPFARLWPVAPSLSLAVYLAVIVVSALLAIGFLLVSPTYRLWSKAEGA